jgi:chemotaxis protein MotB
MKKRLYKPGLDAEAAAGWQTNYCSLSLIIVVFFVMLVSYSAADGNKMKHLKGALTGAPAGAGEKQHEAATQRSIASEPQHGGMWVNGILLTLNKTVTASGMEKEVTVERFLGGVRVKFNSDIVFSQGSASLGRNIYPYLDEMARVAQERHLSIAVQGHTDDVPISNREYPTNWELSAARAVNVVRYFIREHAFPAERLTAEGFAQYRPLLPNSTPEGRRKNRRIEVLLGH